MRILRAEVWLRSVQNPFGDAGGQESSRLCSWLRVEADESVCVLVSGGGDKGLLSMEATDAVLSPGEGESTPRDIFSLSPRSLVTSTSRDMMRACNSALLFSRATM